MTISDEYNYEIQRLIQEKTDEFSTTLYSRYSFKNKGEREIINNIMSQRAIEIVTKNIKNKKNTLIPPCNTSQMLRNLEEIRTAIRSTIDKEVKEDEPFCVNYHKVRGLIEEEFDGGYGIILLVGAGISNAPRRVQEIAKRILHSHGIECTDEWNDENWKSIEQYRDEFQLKFSDAASLNGIDPTICQKIIAELYEQKKITQVIVFNWDNLIETSYYISFNKTLYTDVDIIVGNTSPNEYNQLTQHIWHPHGYLGHPFHFILPHEGGIFPKILEEYCNNNFYGKYIIIGFRDEKHQNIGNFLHTIENRRIIRIRLNGSNSQENTLILDRDHFLRLLQCWI